MSTSIEWTDETWNPVVGCTKASGGCDHCYAKTEHDRRHKAALAGKVIHPQYLKPFETVQLMPDRLAQPLHWRKPRRVFVNSVSDVFHEDVPVDYIAQLWAIMALAPAHTFQVLTKRAERMQRVLEDPEFREACDIYADHYAQEFSDPGDRRKNDLRATCPDLLESDEHWPLKNVWLGVSVENQACANYRIPLLLQTPAAVRFLSCEPLLGPLDVRGYLLMKGAGATVGIDWVIAGGESGPGARSCRVDWIGRIQEHCRAAGVPLFVKQLGADPRDGLDGRYHLRNRKGGDPSEWPEWLRVRQFPTPQVPA